MTNLTAFESPGENPPGVTLDNCDREPIHIPGRIQSHGVLVAFDTRGVVTHLSVNAQALLGAAAPRMGQALAETLFAADPAMHAAVQQCFEADGVHVQQVALETVIGERTFELVGHRLGGRVTMELELCLAPGKSFADHAFQGHRALNRLRGQRGISELLEAAVQEVRTITGFDRVMAYRFRLDGSGDIMAEARRDDLEPFLGRRYPASDIPAQARRLYTINTLRNIADVGSVTVPVQAAPGQDEPLDMSHCVLRGVSPVHIEYLTNMGVAASMSISIVIHGELWGMLACHHMTPRHVPYSVRSACDVLAQILGAHVQGLEARLRSQRIDAAATLRARAVESVLLADDGIFALMPLAAQMCEVLDAHGVAFAENAKLATWGEVPVESLQGLVAWLNELQRTQRQPLVAMHELSSLPAALRLRLGNCCGVLAMRFDELSQGWVLFVRKEQLETIAWGGRPVKEYVSGPLGPRLTPRGSFDVWKETVRGQSEPWSAVDLEIAQSLMAELLRVSAGRHAELGHTRNHLLSMLQDEFSDPQERTLSGTNGSGRNRMRRLVSQVLDASRLQAGTPLGLQRTPLDLAQVVAGAIDQARAAFADTRFIRELPRQVPLHGDAARLHQVVASLLDYACVQGEAGEAILVQLRMEAGHAVLEVSHTGADITGDIMASMLNPFRPRGSGHSAIKDELGLSLYIAGGIAREHGGELAFTYAEPYVLASLTLALKPDQ
ncbi:MAG: GAF domain-containing protein [Ramlibacter sp.]